MWCCEDISFIKVGVALGFFLDAIGNVMTRSTLLWGLHSPHARDFHYLQFAASRVGMVRFWPRSA